jgi:hypothetical protein
MKERFSQSDGGFSLTGVLSGVAFLGVILAVVVPSLGEMVNRRISEAGEPLAQAGARLADFAGLTESALQMAGARETPLEPGNGFSPAPWDPVVFPCFSSSQRWPCRIRPPVPLHRVWRPDWRREESRRRHR